MLLIKKSEDKSVSTVFAFPCLIPDLDFDKFLPASHAKAGWIGWVHTGWNLGNPSSEVWGTGKAGKVRHRQGKQAPKIRQDGKGIQDKKWTFSDCLTGQILGLQNIELLQSIQSLIDKSDKLMSSRNLLYPTKVIRPGLDQIVPTDLKEG